MIRRMFAAALVPAALLILGVTASAATTFSGSKADAHGDAPSHGDVFRVSATYNSTGTLKAKFRLASYSNAAAHRTVVGGFFAKFRHGRCDISSGAGLTLETDTKVAAAGVAANGRASSQPAKASIRGNTVRLSARGRNFKGMRLNCVVVRTLVPTGPTTSRILDALVVRLRAQ